jgi:hypothetical protein
LISSSGVTAFSGFRMPPLVSMAALFRESIERS